MWCLGNEVLRRAQPDRASAHSNTNTAVARQSPCVEKRTEVIGAIGLHAKGPRWVTFLERSSILCLSLLLSLLPKALRIRACNVPKAHTLTIVNKIQSVIKLCIGLRYMSFGLSPAIQLLHTFHAERPKLRMARRQRLCCDSQRIRISG